MLIDHRSIFDLPFGKPFKLRPWRKRLLKRILPHLLRSFHPPSPRPTHYHIGIRITISKSVLPFLIVGILQHVHRVSFWSHVIWLNGFLVCVQVQEVCLVWYEWRVFLLLENRLSEGIDTWLGIAAMSESHLRLVVCLLAWLVAFYCYVLGISWNRFFFFLLAQITLLACDFNYRLHFQVFILLQLRFLY
jgi:hypothetical protein